ncbi:MAG: TusE/DsrC/DsvC family sulfur relay protein [bacterium]|nr:TusE/DsrC/DsvC family sulfur relay protein [bacterium]
MTDIHEEMAGFLREYYHQYEGVPPVKKLIKEMQQRVGQEKWDNSYLEDFYPAGPGRKLCEMAGLPKTAGELQNASTFGGGGLI